MTEVRPHQAVDLNYEAINELREATLERYLKGEISDEDYRASMKGLDHIASLGSEKPGVPAEIAVFAVGVTLLAGAVCAAFLVARWAG
jgi:hypothetical protein